jgi:hypothetical protein
MQLVGQFSQVGVPSKNAAHRRDAPHRIGLIGGHLGRQDDIGRSSVAGQLLDQRG